MNDISVTVEAAGVTNPGPAQSLVKKPSWRALLARVVRGELVRNVLLLTGGTAIGQAILILSAPVLTRLYGPESFGALAVFGSLVSLLAVIAAFRYEVAIPLPEDNGQAANLLVLSLLVVALTTLVTGGAVILLGDQIAALFHFEMLQPYFWLIPAGLLAAGIHRVLGMWMIRQRDFSQLAKISIVQGINQAACQIGMGALGFGSLGLILGDVVGRASCSGTLLRRSWQTSKPHLRQTGRRNLGRAAMRYWRFPLLSSGAAFLNTASIYAPIMLFALFYDLKVVGWLALAQRVIGVPTTLLSNSVASVYLGECARMRHEAPTHVARLFLKTVVSQSALAMLIVICVALPAPWVFGCIFGADWAEAGWFVFLLTPMFAAKFVAFPLGGTLDVFEKQGTHIIRELLRLVVMIAAVLAAGYLHLNPFAAIGLLSVASCLAYCLGILLVRRVIHEATH